MSAARRRPNRGLVRLAALAVIGLLIAVLTGCSGSSSASTGSSSKSGLTAATKLPTPVNAPSFVLTDTSGASYDFKTKTAGHVTLLYFGYTNCPDVCPTTMADIAVALQQLGASASGVTVVFVTTDPVRDTGPVIKAWLTHFNTAFVGLTGTQDAVDAAADSVGVPIEPPVREADGTYSVTHGAQVLAFSADGKARAVFLAGVGSDGYIHDLPLIVANKV
jgi:protein SCO1